VGIGKAHNWIAHQLAWTMPSDLSTAINIDHRGAVDWSLIYLRAFSSGIDRWVFKQNEGIGFFSSGDTAMESALDGQSFFIFDQAAAL
jgi:hypothetical protein